MNPLSFGFLGTAAAAAFALALLPSEPVQKQPMTHPIAGSTGVSQANVGHGEPHAGHRSE